MAVHARESAFVETAFIGLPRPKKIEAFARS